MAVKNKATAQEADIQHLQAGLMQANARIVDIQNDIRELLIEKVAKKAAGAASGWRDPAKSVDELLQIIGAQHPGLASAASVFFNAASATRAWFFANGIMAGPTEVAAFAQHIVDQEPRHTHGVRVAQMDAMRAAAPKP